MIDSLERSRASSREAKRRRIGTCAICGGETRYGGQPGGPPVSRACASCARQTSAFPRWVLEYLARLYEGGMTAGEIGARYGRDRRTIILHLERAGVKRRRRGPRRKPTHGRTVWW